MTSKISTFILKGAVEWFSLSPPILNIIQTSTSFSLWIQKTIFSLLQTFSSFIMLRDKNDLNADENAEKRIWWRGMLYKNIIWNILKALCNTQSNISRLHCTSFISWCDNRAHRNFHIDSWKMYLWNFWNILLKRRF